MEFTASSSGSGRPRRSSSVCHSKSMASAKRSFLIWLSGCSSNCAIVVILLKTDRRAASVGCAVNTGRTEKLSSQFCKSLVEKSLPSRWALAIFSIALPSHEPSDLCSTARSFDRFTCSATFAKLKKLLNARTREIVCESVNLFRI